MHHTMVLMIAILLLTFGTKPSYATSADTSCGIIWDGPILLSDTTVNGHSPQIALSGDDTIHVVWEGGPERLPYARSTNGGASFIRHDLDSASSTELIWARLCSEGQRVYVFFRTPIAGGSPMLLKRSTDGGTSWDTVGNISTNVVGEIRSASVSGDTLGVISSIVGVKRILRSTDGGQTWTQANEGLNYFARATLSPGVLHLVQMGSNETEYRRSHDLGNTWVQQTLLSSVDGLQSSDPTIAASTTPGDTTVIAAWRDMKYGCIGLVGCSVIGRSGVSGMDSTTWVPEQVLTSIPRGYEPSLSVHNGRIGVGWPMDQFIGQSDPPFAEVQVSHGTSWCSVFDPTSGLATRIVIAVSVALASNGVHVVWEASQAPDPSTFRIFYRRGVFKTTDIRDNPSTLPQLVRLEQNYPNPFNPSTRIAYRLSKTEFVSLRVYDILSRELARLVNEQKEAGQHVVTWNAEDMPSGMYYYRLITPDGIETRKAVLIK